MLLKLLTLFIIIPLVEIAIIVKLGTVIGFWYTMLIVVLTGVAGAYLSRYQGLTVYRNIMAEINIGRLPSDDMIDGLLILTGGIVLLTPGFLTDIAGLALLVPYSRKHIKVHLKRFLAVRMNIYDGSTRITIDE